MGHSRHECRYKLYLVLVALSYKDYVFTSVNNALVQYISRQSCTVEKSCFAHKQNTVHDEGKARGIYNFCNNMDEHDVIPQFPSPPNTT